MSGGWLSPADANGTSTKFIVLGRNIVKLEHDDNFANGWRYADGRLQHAILAIDTGGQKHLLWLSRERPGIMEQFSDEARAEAQGMLRQIADHFAESRTGPAT